MLHSGCRPTHIAKGQWSECESQASSTWRELEAINRILQAYSKLMKEETVKWLTDNQNVVIENGSRKHSYIEHSDANSNSIGNGLDT